MSDFAQLQQDARLHTPLPVNTTAPALAGSGKCGQELSVTNGNWNNMGEWAVQPNGYSYQWRAAAVALPGATRSTYTPKTADIAAAVDCIVTARNIAGATAGPASNAITITAS
jgi:hypothetical protein